MKNNSLINVNETGVDGAGSYSEIRRRSRRYGNIADDEPSGFSLRVRVSRLRHSGDQGTGR